MKILLDTHAFIWFLEGIDKLSLNAKKVIEADENTVFISVASLWEMAIKTSMNKLEMTISFETLNVVAWENGIEILPVQFGHTKIVAKLPFHHRDPFDRMIIAQSIFENMPIVTADAYFPLYNPQIIW